ncbi:hypothetical protein, partial [Qingrenia yutianensis]|uniref:hypothetical protein n=1 Tax=Qingrenia yutianensis TaxID=2763676 RepID=UPI0037428B68
GMNEISRQLAETTKEVEELIQNKKTFSKADKEKILSTLNRVTRQISSSYPYMYSMFNEQMDKTVTSLSTTLSLYAFA